MAFYFCQEAVVLASLPNNTENHCKQLGKLCQTQKYSWQDMNTARCSFPGLSLYTPLLQLLFTWVYISDLLKLLQN